MNTIHFKENVSVERYQMAVRVLEAIGFHIEKVQEKHDLPKEVIKGIERGLKDFREGNWKSTEEVDKIALEICGK